MRILKGEEEEHALQHLSKAAKIALNSSCQRAKCGSLILKDNKIISEGFNSPPADKKSQSRCMFDKDLLHKRVTDKTCCVHAEQRAIMSALKNNSEKLASSRLYFARLDKEGNLQRSGEPYCTICSKMALDAGISEFVLFKKEGVCVYDTEEYNNISFKYQDLKDN